MAAAPVRETRYLVGSRRQPLVRIRKSFGAWLDQAVGGLAALAVCWHAGREAGWRQGGRQGGRRRQQQRGATIVGSDCFHFPPRQSGVHGTVKLANSATLSEPTVAVSLPGQFLRLFPLFCEFISKYVAFTRFLCCVHWRWRSLRRNSVDLNYGCAAAVIPLTLKQIAAGI